jgi:hypothetical protein
MSKLYKVAVPAGVLYADIAEIKCDRFPNLAIAHRLAANKRVLRDLLHKLPPSRRVLIASTIFFIHALSGILEMQT